MTAAGPGRRPHRRRQSSHRPSSHRKADAGVTLIEMMVALALFAVIAGAGFSMLDQVLRAQRGTEGRLALLAERQRAMHLVLADFAMADPHSLQVSGTDLSLARGRTGGSLHLRYSLAGNGLHRELADSGGVLLADQTILTGISSLEWRFLTAEGAWSDRWPADDVQTLTAARNPMAVELSLTLSGSGGTLRRVAPLPADLQ